MVYQPRATADAATVTAIPPTVAVAASEYQRSREVEKQQLALMAQHNLLNEWTAEVRATVLEARERIREARLARDHFRQQVREFVLALRAAHEPLSSVLRQTRAMVQLLESAGAIQSDDGWLEADVLEWAIEDYESAA
ncbi:MAG TPA: hypothetical protein VLN49_00950 [Gemmatimonadaceae bacterium]|nr:hypothetical protein [Gemmatimonadaceae bacterium]